jgi:hypothetical protein
MSSALDRLRAAKKPNSVRVNICMDPRLVDRVTQLEAKRARVMGRMQQGRNPDPAAAGELEDVESELDDARGAAKAHSEWFLVTALAPSEFDGLVDAHKPTKDQRADARKQLGPQAQLAWNTETFPPALLEACVSVITVEDDGEESYEALTAEFVTEMRKGGAWNEGEFNALVDAALKVNKSTSQVNAAGNG